MNRSENIIDMLLRPNGPQISINETRNIVSLSFNNFMIIDIYVQEERLHVIKIDSTLSTLNSIRDMLVANEGLVISMAKALMLGYRYGKKPNC